MKQIQASCSTPGILYIPSNYSLTNGFSTTGNYADYTFDSAKLLHGVAITYDKVNRNGKVVSGRAYSLKMAENDFEKFSIAAN